MPPPDGASPREQWARLRLLIIGQLLAAPPPRGELKQRLTELSAQTWRHPMHGGEVRFGVSTLERWLARARRSPDPATLLATVPRVDAGRMRVISAELATAIRESAQSQPAVWREARAPHEIGSDAGAGVAPALRAVA